jgi:hypothetical protein
VLTVAAAPLIYNFPQVFGLPSSVFFMKVTSVDCKGIAGKI